MISRNAQIRGLLVALLGAGCGESPAPTFSGSETGGATATGGTSTSGGAASGGTSASTGGAATGGTSTATGGALSSGGSAVSTGGSSSGGASASGGKASSGGSPASGGTTGTAGNSGASAGAAGTAPSTGCGASTWPPGDGSTLLSIDVGGTARQYILSLPAGYDPSKPYRVIYAWHGRTGTAAQIASGGNRAYYGLKSLLPDTIFVAGQGLGTAADPADTGWPNTGGADIAMVRALVAHLATSYCVDQNRILSTGFSYGGIMSNTIGCQMSDVFRAIAPIAGAYFGGRNASCNTHPIAYFGIHGTADDQVTYANGEAAREIFRASAHCAATTQPAEPSPCVLYDGCDGGYPVYWCSHTGNHTVPSFSAAGIAAFFKQF